MTDIALTWIDGNGDIAIEQTELVLDDSLTNAVIISLFTDLRVEGQRGWWGESFSQPIGSKLWRLNREKQLPGILDTAKQYAEEALQWLIDEKLVQDIVVTASNPETAFLLLSVAIKLLDGSTEQREFKALWTQ
ncbi:phage GP46 family protein [Frederiksenia canicola]